ncbi:hypothetical protein EBU71_05235 [bacterium]|nr:hypothetical protein [Candidatus Elulimicrobium humile]
MNIYVSGHNWSAKVEIDKTISKSDRYSEACTRAIECLLDQEEKKGVEIKIDDYENFGLGLILLTWDEKDAKNEGEHRVILTSNILANAGRWEDYKQVKDYEDKCKEEGL